MFLKITKYKNGRSFLNIVKSYRDKNHKPKQKTVKKIGYLDELEEEYDNPIVHFKEVAKQMTEEEKQKRLLTLEINTDETLAVDTDNLYNLGYFYIKRLFKELKIPEFFNKFQKTTRFKTKLSKVFLFCVINRILNPGSVNKWYESIDRYFENFDFSQENTYRSYDYFDQASEKLQRFLYEQVEAISPYEKKVCRYDVTNYFFEIRYSDEPEFNEQGEKTNKAYRQKGMSKEHRTTPIIQMGLLLDERGIPMGYHLYPGNESEKVHFLPFIKKIKKEYDIGRIVVIADRGLNSGDNTTKLAGINNDDYKSNDGYIFGQSVRGADKEFKEWALSEEGYTVDTFPDIDQKTGLPKIDPKTDEPKLIHFKHKSRFIAREKKITNSQGIRVPVTVYEKQMVYFSGKYQKQHQKERERAINKALKLINSPGLYNQSKHKGAIQYIEDVKFNKETGEIATGSILELNTAKIEEEAKYDGYFAIITSEKDMTDKQLRDAYHSLWEIEETFKISKSELKTRPIGFWTEAHIRAHFLICYVALLITRLIRLSLNNEFSYKKIFKALRSFQCVYFKDNLYQVIYFDEVLQKLEKIVKTPLNKKYLTRKEIHSLVNS